MKKADATRENRTEGFTNAVEFETGELSKVTGQAVIDFGRSIGAIHDQGAGELILIQLSDKQYGFAAKADMLLGDIDDILFPDED